MRIFFTVAIVSVLWACTEPLPKEVIEDAPEASLVVAEKIMSPEARALENKIANRTLLQKIVDESENFQRVEYAYACNNHTGGLLTLIKDETALKGIRFAISEEGWNEFVSLYYKGEDLAFAVHEEGKWMGEEETDVQTVFYLDDGAIIRCMRKQASGATAQIEQLIKAAEFEVISGDEALLQKLKNYEDVFKNKATKDNMASLFCR